jgi:perosamine synthetase
MTGSFGHMSCFSFYANKVITTGEGGMITTNDEEYAKHLRLLRNLAFTEPRFRHELAGFNFRMPGFVAALGLAQFRKIDKIVEEKRRVAHSYSEKLKDIPGLQLPAELDWAKNVYWMYGLVVKPGFGISRDKLIEALNERGIESRTFFCPMNQQPVLRKISGFREIPCPVADSLWNTGLYLPSTWNLSEENIAFICDAIRQAPDWES